MNIEKFLSIKEALGKAVKNTIFENKTYVVGGAVTSRT